MDYTKVKNFALELVLQGENLQRLFVKTLMDNLSDVKREKLVDYINAHVYKTKREKLRLWLENRYKKNIDEKPHVLAKKARYYMNMNVCMLPFLIKESQRAKDRIRKRKNKTK